MRFSALGTALGMSFIFSIAISAAQKWIGFDDAVYYAITLPVSLALGIFADGIHGWLFGRRGK